MAQQEPACSVQIVCKRQRGSAGTERMGSMVAAPIATRLDSSTQMLETYGIGLEPIGKQPAAGRERAVPGSGASLVVRPCLGWLRKLPDWRVADIVIPDVSVTRGPWIARRSQVGFEFRSQLSDQAGMLSLVG